MTVKLTLCNRILTLLHLIVDHPTDMLRQKYLPHGKTKSRMKCDVRVAIGISPDVKWAGGLKARNTFLRSPVQKVTSF